MFFCRRISLARAAARAPALPSYRCPFELDHLRQLARARAATMSAHLSDIALMSVETDKLLRYFASTTAGNSHSTNSSSGSNQFGLGAPPPERPSIIDACKLLTAEAAKVDGEVVVGGSVAAMLYMPPRATKDIDINFYSPTPITTRKEFRRVFGQMKHADLSSMQFENSLVPLKVSKLRPRIIFGSITYAGWPLDVYFHVDGPANDRARSHSIFRDGVSYAPPECVATWKMMSLRSSSRYLKDRADVEALLATVRKDFDATFVRDCLVLHEDEQGRVAEWDGYVSGIFRKRLKRY